MLNMLTISRQLIDAYRNRRFLPYSYISPAELLYATCPPLKSAVQRKTSTIMESNRRQARVGVFQPTSTIDLEHNPMHTPNRGQKSPFLRQPAELRNRIYKFIAENEKVLRPIDTSCRDGHKAYTPPLSLACRQTRAEYRGIYLAYAPTCNSIVDVDLNIESRYGRGTFGRTLGDVLQPYVNTMDTLVIRMRLDNTWDNSELHRYAGTWLENDHYRAPWGVNNRVEGRVPPHEFIVVFDSRAFDMYDCSDRLRELDWMNKTSRDTSNESYYDAWPQIKAAFMEAFERHQRQLLACRNGGPKRRKATGALWTANAA